MYVSIRTKISGSAQRSLTFVSDDRWQHGHLLMPHGKFFTY